MMILEVTFVVISVAIADWLRLFLCAATAALAILLIIVSALSLSDRLSFDPGNRVKYGGIPLGVIALTAAVVWAIELVNQLSE